MFLHSLIYAANINIIIIVLLLLFVMLQQSCTTKIYNKKKEIIILWTWWLWSFWNKTNRIYVLKSYEKKGTNEYKITTDFMDDDLEV